MAKFKQTLTLFIVVIFVIGLVAWLVPVPAPHAQVTLPRPQSLLLAPQLSWPASGQAAIGAKGYGILETHAPQTAVPTASVAKVFTAVAVLKQKPLQPGQQGPIITITQADIDSYNSYFLQGGSLAQISLGEQISERQALEALMLPSANNMADTLVRWAFGSIDNYVAYINKFNASQGLTNTHIADASGFSSQTVSTAEDLVKIGQLAIADPVLASIVSESSATIPVAGLIQNTNWLLGTNNVNGIKTGNTDAAGGCYLFSSLQQVGGQNLTIVGAVMAAPTLQDAINYSRGMLTTVKQGFATQPVLSQGQTLGSYTMAWGKKVPIVVGQPASAVYWYSQRYSQNYSVNKVKTIQKGQKVGEYRLTSGPTTSATSLVAGNASGSAPWRWRLYQRYL